MDTRKHFDAWWSEHHKELRPEKVEEAAWMIWQAATVAERARKAKVDAMTRNGPTQVTINGEVRYSSDERQ